VPAPGLRAVTLVAAGALLAPAGALAGAVAPAAADSRPAGRAAAGWSGHHAPAAAHRTGRPQASRTQVVVRYRSSASAERRGRLTRSVAATAARPLLRLGVDLLRVADATSAAAELSRQPDVVYAEPLVYARRTAATASYDPTDAPERTELSVQSAYDADPRARGTGQVVAVVDDGVDATNPDLVGRVQDGGFFPESGPRQPTGGTFGSASASSPHGTAVAAVLAGAQDGKGVQGMAPQASVRSYRVFAAGSLDAPSTAVAAAVRAVADDAVRDPALRVANFSLGMGVDSRVVRDAVAYAHRTAPQLLLVAAAGNEGDIGSLRPSYPAGDPGVLSVGASGYDRVSSRWEQSGFSTKGDVDVLAPGEAVHTWYPARECDDATSSQTSRTAVVCPVSGTSFAAPEVAGIAAQLAAVGVTGTAARTAIKASALAAHPSPGQPAVGDGSGRANAAAALALATGSAPYTAVFLDRGAVLGGGADRQVFEAVRVDPLGGAELPVVTASAGTVTGTSRDTSRPGLGVLRGSYLAPAYPGQALHGLALTATSGAARDSMPVAVVPATAGDGGQPAADRANYSMRSLDPATSGGYAYDMYTRSVYLQAGAPFRVTVTYPSSPSPLYVSIPDLSGGTASVQSDRYYELGYDRCRTTAPLARGTHVCAMTAPVTGRYAFSLDNTYDGASYAFSVDATTPVATAPAVLSSVGQTPVVPLSWNAARTPGLRYDVDVIERTQTNPSGTTWTRWRTGTTATSLRRAGHDGSTSLFRVRAVPPGGRPSAWSATVRSVAPYDERTALSAYSSSWVGSAASGRWESTLRTATRTGASLTLSAKGWRVTLVGDRCSTCGKVTVYVDGRYAATVDTRATTLQRRVSLWRSAMLAGGPARSHSLRLVVAGTSGRPAVHVDGFAVDR